MNVNNFRNQESAISFDFKNFIYLSNECIKIPNRLSLCYFIPGRNFPFFYKFEILILKIVARLLACYCFLIFISIYFIITICELYKHIQVFCYEFLSWFAVDKQRHLSLVFKAAIIVFYSASFLWLLCDPLNHTFYFFLLDVALYLLKTEQKVFMLWLFAT